MNPYTFYLTLGLVFLAAEILIFQLSFFWFLFVGLGALVAAAVGYFVPGASWLLTTSVFVVASTIIFFVLYRPLRKWQKKPGPIAGNDAIGQQVEVVTEITPQKTGKVMWSGTDWVANTADSDETIEPGAIAYIVKLEGIQLTVSASKPQSVE